jgi:hypothetical protein
MADFPGALEDFKGVCLQYQPTLPGWTTVFADRYCDCVAKNDVDQMTPEEWADRTGKSDPRDPLRPARFKAEQDKDIHSAFICTRKLRCDPGAPPSWAGLCKAKGWGDE